MKAAIVLLVAVLTGCATNQHDAQIAAAKFQALAQMNERRPLFELSGYSCADPANCRVVVFDPNQKPVEIREASNGWDAVIAATNSAAGLISGAVPFAALGAVAIRGIDRAGGNDHSVTNTNTDASTTSTTSDSNNVASTSSTVSDSYNTSSTSSNVSDTTTIADSYNTSSTSSSSATTNTSTTTTSSSSATTSGNTTTTEIQP